MKLDNFNVHLKFSLQRALLGNVTPNVRAVIANLENKNINLYFYYDGVISDDDEETASVVETEVIADFDQDFSINKNLQRIDFPQEITGADGVLVYLRDE